MKVKGIEKTIYKTEKSVEEWKQETGSLGEALQIQRLGGDSLDGHPTAREFVESVNERYETATVPSGLPTYDALYQRGNKQTSITKSRKHPYGIDSVKLHATSYALKKRELITNSMGEMNSKLFKLEQDHNTGEVTLELVNMGGAGLSWCKCRENELSIWLNLPKLLRGNNLKEIRTPGELLQALQEAEERLFRRYGLKLDLLNSAVTGIELTRTAEMPRYVSSYSPVFARLSYGQLTRTTYQNGNQTFKNGEHSIVFYDKKLLSKKKVGKDLRIEYKIKHSKKMRRVLNRKTNPTPADIYKHWNTLINETYNTMINTILKRTKSTPAQPSQPDPVAAFESGYRAAKKDGRQSPYLKSFEAMTLARLTGDEREACLDIVRQDDSHQTGYYFKGLMDDLEPYADASRSVSHSTLLDELDAAFQDKHAQKPVQGPVT